MIPQELSRAGQGLAQNAHTAEAGLKFPLDGSDKDLQFPGPKTGELLFQILFQSGRGLFLLLKFQ